MNSAPRPPNKSFFHRVVSAKLRPSIVPRTAMKSTFVLPTTLGILLLSAAVSPAAPAAKKAPPPAPQWADWIEPDFPFFSSIIDARKAHKNLPADNLAIRGLVLNLGHDCWACFDTDLLRMSALWRGPGVTPDALAPKSNLPGGTKTRGGQSPLPRPDGRVWFGNGIYPGWQSGSVLLEDPREPAPSPEEIGRGPIDEKAGRFEAVRLTSRGAVLEYRFGDAQVREWSTAEIENGAAVIRRTLEVGPAGQPLTLVVGRRTGGDLALGQEAGPPRIDLRQDDGLWTARVPARKKAIRFSLTFTESGPAAGAPPAAIPAKLPPVRWAKEVVTRAQISAKKAAYVVDNIELPNANPWRRNIRPGDIQFLKDGTGVVVALDGDVWLVRGLRDNLKEIRWKRFASGLHEPMTAAIRDNQVYVFDKNGIWRLRDTDGNGEADVHELFSNAFAQTADMREFPSTLRLAPKGEFVIAKGGQQATTLGKHNGSVLRVSADGRRSTVLGYGFRQPAAGVNVRTGLVTVGDQEGQYIPSSPLHIVRDKQYYGFLSDGLQEREKYPAPIADPLTWIPHSVNASAISQVWLFDAKMGPLNDTMVHIGFNRPELFQVVFNHRASKPQASVVSVTRDFLFPPLNGSVNPADGQLYIAGFQIAGWGNLLNELTGMGRVRYTGAPAVMPREIAPMDKGVLLRFDAPLNPESANNPDNFSLASWHYVRTYKYGSAQFKADDKPGIDWITPSSAYLSKDKRSVFVSAPGMKPVMQLRVGWSLKTAAGASFSDNAYTTPYTLPKFDPIAEGFGKIEVDLTPRIAAARESGPVTVAEGRRLYQLLGCVACHSVNGDDIAKVGPTWMGLSGSNRPVFVGKKKATVAADKDYLRESILDPTAKLVQGFQKGEYAMPSYAGVATDSQIDALILYIQSVKEGDPEARAAAAAAPLKQEDPGSFE